MDIQPTAQQQQRFWQTRFFLSGFWFLMVISMSFTRGVELFSWGVDGYLLASGVLLGIATAMGAYGMYRTAVEEEGNYIGGGNFKGGGSPAQAKAVLTVWRKQTSRTLPVYVLGAAIIVTLFHFFGTGKEFSAGHQSNFSFLFPWILYIVFILSGSAFAQSIAHLIIIPPRSEPSAIVGEEGAAR